MGGGRIAFALLAATVIGHAGSSCIVGGTFACSDDDECGANGTGVCEASGWCSFPDPDCPSGRRYSPWSGDDLANDCAPAGPGTGSSTAASGSLGDGESSSAPAQRDSDGPDCGNGIREAGEDCDELDAVDGDGCNVGCVFSGTLEWATRIESQGDDFGHDVAVASTGVVYVAAQQAGQNGNAWVLRLEPDGTMQWSEFFGGGPPDAALGIALAEDLPDGDDVIARALFVVGYQTPSDNPEPPPPEQANHITRRYDDYGGGPGQDWSDAYNSSPDGDDRLADVAVASTLDRVVVFGHVRADVMEVDADAAVRAYPSGASNDAWFFDDGIDGANDDKARAGVIDEDGLVWTVGDRTLDNGDVDAWIAHIAVGGDPLVATRQWTAIVANATRDDAFNDVAIDAGGMLVAVGHRGTKAWIAGWLRDTDAQAGADEPSWDLEPPDVPADAVLFGIAFDGTGAVVIVGAVETAGPEDHGDDAWVQKLDPGLTKTIWTAPSDGSASGDDIARAVAIGPDDRVVVVGDRLEVDADDLEDGVDRDVWIEVHLP